MESLRKVLQKYSEASLTLGSPKSSREVKSLELDSQNKSDAAASGIERGALQKSLTKLSQRNEKYFVIGIGMAVILFVSLVIVAFIQIGNSNAARAIPPIFGSSAALVVWKTLKTWREKNYTDCLLALVPNVDDETLRSIIAALVRRM
jgi:hypothetical protein